MGRVYSNATCDYCGIDGCECVRVNDGYRCCRDCLFARVAEDELTVGETSDCVDCGGNPAEYCGSCLDNALNNKDNACDGCGDDYHSVYCEDCARDNFGLGVSTCYNCGDLVEDTEGGELWCIACAKAYLLECEDCGMPATVHRCAACSNATSSVVTDDGQDFLIDGLTINWRD